MDKLLQLDVYSQVAYNAISEVELKRITDLLLAKPSSHHNLKSIINKENQKLEPVYLKLVQEIILKNNFNSSDLNLEDHILKESMSLGLKQLNTKLLKQIQQIDQLSHLVEQLLEE